MKRVLVTGANGFIGRRTFSHLLERGFEVHGCGLGAAPTEAGDCPWYDVDLLAQGAVHELISAVRPTHLLHLAWHVSKADYWVSPANLDWAQASRDLVEEFARHGGRRVASAGTCAEYDWRAGVLSENETPLLPRTVYGAAKHLFGLILSEMDCDALSTAWGRVFFVYGPHENPGRLVASVTRSLLAGEPARCSHGRQVRDFSHVDDVAGAFAALLESDVRGAVNVASGTAVAIRQVVEAVASEAERPELVELGALTASPDEPAQITADVRRLREEVGWRPRYDLRSGVLDTVAWWRGQLSEGAS